VGTLTLLFTLVLVSAVSASTRLTLAVHFVPGASYTGKTCITPGGIPHTGCVVKFRASADGSSLRFAGSTVIDSWRCNGGGGEALIGGTVKGATPVPVVRLRSTGVLYGSVGTGTHRAWVSGQLAVGGHSAALVFHSGSAAYACHTNPVTLRVTA
jgi:hypothetical protein